MNVHKVVAAVAENVRPSNVEEVDGMAKLRDAKKFEINISLEALKVSIDYARELIKFGVFALPFDVCYFEMPLKDENTNDEDLYSYGTLCWTHGNTILGRFYAWYSEGTQCGRTTFDVLKCSQYRPAILKDRRFFWGSRVDDSVPIVRNSYLKDKFLKQSVVDDSDDPAGVCEAAAMFGSVIPLMGVGALALSGLSKERVEISEKHNRARLRNGKEPLFAHTKLTVPFDTSPKSGNNIRCMLFGKNSPCLHWRRGHVRRLSSGKITGVKPCLVGAGGLVTHDYELT